LIRHSKSLNHKHGKEYRERKKNEKYEGKT